MPKFFGGGADGAGGGRKKGGIEFTGLHVPKFLRSFIDSNSDSRINQEEAYKKNPLYTGYAYDERMQKRLKDMEAAKKRFTEARNSDGTRADRPDEAPVIVGLDKLVHQGLTERQREQLVGLMSEEQKIENNPEEIKVIMDEFGNEDSQKLADLIKKKRKLVKEKRSWVKAKRAKYNLSERAGGIRKNPLMAKFDDGESLELGQEEVAGLGRKLHKEPELVGKPKETTGERRPKLQINSSQRAVGVGALIKSWKKKRRKKKRGLGREKEGEGSEVEPKKKRKQALLSFDDDI